LSRDSASSISLDGVFARFFSNPDSDTCLRPHLVDFAAKVSSSALTVLSDVLHRSDDGSGLLIRQRADELFDWPRSGCRPIVSPAIASSLISHQKED
jgi:hypothetical protein